MKKSYLAVLLLTTSCASIVDGQDQVISIDTRPTTGAICELKNDQGTYFVNSTPGTVTISRSASDMAVVCEKEDYGSGMTVVHSDTKAMAFGNILFGGIIGAGVDMASGAAYIYPSTVQVPIRKGAPKVDIETIKLETNKKAQEEKSSEYPQAKN